MGLPIAAGELSAWVIAIAGTVGGVYAVLVAVWAGRRTEATRMKVGSLSYEAESKRVREELENSWNAGPTVWATTGTGDWGSTADWGTATATSKSEKGSTNGRSEPSDKTLAIWKEYHTNGLAQSRISFRFSLIFASLGFAIIAASVVQTALAEDPDINAANTVSLLGATVMEAVSGLFFVQSNKARVTMMTFFDKLRSDRALDESLKLSDGIPDPLIKSRLQTVLALSLAEAKATDDVLKVVMASKRSDAAPGNPAGAAEFAGDSEHPADVISS